MVTLSHKAKQFSLVLAKLLLVGGALYYLFQQLQQKSISNFDGIVSNFSAFSLLGIILLSVFNWLFEFLKWKNLVEVVERISLYTATKQVLAGVTAGLFTPNGIGEYAGKALYFPKNETKRILFLNVICNGIQLILTIMFGTLGLLYFNSVFNVVPSKTIVLIFGCVLILNQKSKKI